MAKQSGRLITHYKAAQRRLGLTHAPFVRHSLRHGGATYDYGMGNLTIEDIMQRGRWAGLKATKRYIQEGQAFLQSLKFPTALKARLARRPTDIEAEFLRDYRRRCRHRSRA